MKRLFIAIPADGRLRRLLTGVQRAIPTHGAKVRWTREDHFHVTLRFIGDTADGDIPRIVAAMRRSVAGAAPLEVHVGGGGCFPPRGPVRVLWIGGQDPGGKLDLVAQKLTSEMGLVEDHSDSRTFSIHFTLGRVKSEGRRGKLRDELEALETFDYRLAVRELFLYESQLSSTGPQYIVLHREALAD